MILIHFILTSINTDNYILLTYASVIVLEFALGIFIYYIWIYFQNDYDRFAKYISILLIPL